VGGLGGCADKRPRTAGPKPKMGGGERGGKKTRKREGIGAADGADENSWVGPSLRIWEGNGSGDRTNRVKREGLKTGGVGWRLL